MRKIIGEIKTSQFIDSGVVRVSFEVSCDDWCLIQQSETWKRIENFLAVSGTTGKLMTLVEKVNLLEGCLEPPYKERNAAGSVEGR